MVKLYTDYFEKRYTAHLFSCTTLFIVVAFLATIILPYVIVYAVGCKKKLLANTFSYLG